MSIEKNPKVHRTKAEKLEILKEGEKNGIAVTCRKYGIYEASYYQWKNKFKEIGDAGLQHGMTKEHLKEITRLQKENQRLKDMLMAGQLESQRKDELLKKMYAPESAKKL
jgi:putative transposase